MADLFLILSKVIWTVLRPETWFFLALIATLIAVWRGWRRTALGLLLGQTVAFGALAIWPLGNLLLAPLEARFRAGPAVPDPAAIVVLGGAEEAGRTMWSGLPSIGPSGERFLATIALARLYPEAAVVFTGGSGWFSAGALSGADVAERIFRDSGIDPERMILEGLSRNTWQNAVMTLPLMEDLGDGPILLVTSAYHMPRSVGVFCAAGWDRLIAYPVDFRVGPTFQDPGWWFARNLEELNVGAKEWVGLLAYRLTGRAAAYSVQDNRITCAPRPGAS